MTAQHHLRNTTQALQSTSWKQYMETETRRLDETGVAGAIVSIRLGTTDERIKRQVVGLLGHILQPTDTFDIGANDEISILLAPIAGMVALTERVGQLHARIAKLGAAPLTGYAPRRTDEHLLATLARADANVDRAAFRQERNPLVLVLPENED